MPDHHDIDTHRLNILGCVDEGFALTEAGAARREVNGIRAQTLGSQAEARPRPRGRFEEEIDHDLALERAQFLVPALADIQEFFGCIQNGFNFRPAQIFEVEQMPAGPDEGLWFMHRNCDAHDRLPRQPVGVLVRAGAKPDLGY